MNDHLLVTDEDRVRTITIDRPESKNAMTAAMRNRLCELFADADADPAVKAVVLTGTDPEFSAGVDFKERMSGSSAPVDAALRPNPAAAARAMTTPMVCAVNGACVTGALEIALSSAFIVASDRARFADTHARLNVVAAWGLTALLPRAVGRQRATELSITGRFVAAEEALAIGLVNHVVPHDELMERSYELARAVVDQSAVAEVMRLYRRGDGMSMADALALETDWVAHRPVDAKAFRELGESSTGCTRPG